jgi:hypothetical protein
VAYHWHAFIGVVVVNAFAYTTVLWLSRQTNRDCRWRRTSVALCSLILVFTLGRLLHWDRPLTGSGLILYSLDMWLALRLVTLFWEVGSGSVIVPSLSDFVTWTCLPLTLGGPILRYSQAPAAVCPNRSVWKCRRWWIEGAAATAKIFGGLAIVPLQQGMLRRWPNAHRSTAGVIALSGPVAFYLINAGYCQFMEFLGKSSGFKLPMSYNLPLGRENISAFWANWNMTATAVFRDYIFYNRWGLRSYNMYFNTMILFVLVGLWHAASAYWLMWGSLHGLLFCLFLIWRKHSQKLAGIPLRGTPIALVAARVLTYISVCACWYLPSKILQKLGRV